MYILTVRNVETLSQHRSKYNENEKYCHNKVSRKTKDLYKKACVMSFIKELMARN